MFCRLIMSVACLVLMSQPSYSATLTDQPIAQDNALDILRRSHEEQQNQIDKLNERLRKTEDLLFRAISAVSLIKSNKMKKAIEIVLIPDNTWTKAVVTTLLFVLLHVLKFESMSFSLADSSFCCFFLNIHPSLHRTTKNEAGHHCIALDIKIRHCIANFMLNTLCNSHDLVLDYMHCI